ncbi:hypothetical protein PM082_014151 [Marasmius tenuissimus]|nr:hypothetical protein PM082_014151 [Marasmius tenuissimus]
MAPPLTIFNKVANRKGSKGDLGPPAEKEQVGSDKSEEYSEIRSKINTFAESSEVLLNALESVQAIHPFIGVAVLAFKVVVSLELKRHENDDKVLFLLVKVQDMMKVLVQLRSIPQGARAQDQPATVEEMLTSLCKKIGKDIKNCGNLCDMYSKQPLFAKIFKGPIYELRLADMGETLEERRKELLLVLIMFTADGVQSLQISIRSTEESLKMLQLFEMSRSPLEQQLSDFIKSKGGAERCMKDATIWKELTDMHSKASFPSETEQNNYSLPNLKPHPYHPAPRGSPLRIETGQSNEVRVLGRVKGPGSGHPKSHSNDSFSSRAGSHSPHDMHGKANLKVPAQNMQGIELKHDMELDIDESIRQNRIVFDRKFKEQRRQLEALEQTVIKQGDRVVHAVQEGPHDKIIDEELRAIWKEMGWRVVVPTFKFVPTLHEYLLARHHDMQSVSDHSIRPPPPESFLVEEMSSLTTALALAKQQSEDKWALDCLHLSDMGPICEAFDADASGYVSVWEANQVMVLRPDGWSLLQWLAYWASGRQLTITQYRTQICDVLRDMHVLQRTHVLPLNQSSVDHYLDGMKILDRVLTSVAQVPSDRLPAGELAERVEQYTSTEEKRMGRIMETLRYEIDGQDTIELITNRYQIERNFFPLVYLLLKQHLAIIRTGCCHLLSWRELEIARQSLEVVFRAVRARVSVLKDLLAPRKSNSVFEGLERFGFGMYCNVYRGIDDFVSIPISEESLILEDPVGDPTPQAQSEPPQSQNVEVLVNIDDDDGPLDFESCIGDHINGYWSGFLQDNDRNIIGGVVQFSVSDWDSRNFSGEGSYHGGTLRVKGKFDRDTGTVEATIAGVEDTWVGPLDEMTHLRVTLSGTMKEVPSPYFSNQYTISGTWQDVEEGTDGGTVLLSQTPAWVHQFRWTPPIIRRGFPKPGLAPPLSRRFLDSLATLRWKFALRAVFYRIRSERGVLNAAYCLRKLELIRKSVQLLKHCKVMGRPHVEDKFTMEIIVGATRYLPPSVVRLCHWLAQNGWWPTVHFNSTCQCGMTVVGHRLLHVINPGETKELCSHTGISPRWLHNSGQVKSWRFIHRREASELISKASGVNMTLLKAREWGEPVIYGLKCSGCEKSLATDRTNSPVVMWACLVCTVSETKPPFVICTRCEALGFSSPAHNSPKHRFDHHLLRISSAGPWPPVDTGVPVQISPTRRLDYHPYHNKSAWPLPPVRPDLAQNHLTQQPEHHPHHIRSAGPLPPVIPYLPAQNYPMHRLEHHPHHIRPAGPLPPVRPELPVDPTIYQFSGHHPHHDQSAWPLPPVRPDLAQNHPTQRLEHHSHPLRFVRPDPPVDPTIYQFSGHHLHHDQSTWPLPPIRHDLPLQDPPTHQLNHRSRHIRSVGPWLAVDTDLPVQNSPTDRFNYPHHNRSASPSPLASPDSPEQSPPMRQVEHYPRHIGSASPGWSPVDTDSPLALENRYADSDADSDTEGRLSDYYSCESE